MKKLLGIMVLGILFFISTFTANSAEETIEDIVESLGEIQEEFSKLSPSDNKEADIIDQAIKEINKTTEFVIQTIEKEDTLTAISALSYIDKSLSDVGKIVPNEYESDMSKADIASFAPEKLTTLKAITDEMNKKKVVNTNELLDEIIELNSKGFNTIKISSTLNDLGIDTITLIELDKRKFSILKNEIVDNQLEISSKEESLNNLKYQHDQLQVDGKIENLNKEKLNLTNKYNTELVKQANIAISTDDLNQSKKLTEQFSKEIENVSKQINAINSQASSLTSKIDVLTEEINTKTLASNDLNQKVASLNSQLQNSTKLINSQQTALSQLQNSLVPTQDQLLAITKEKEVINTEVDNLLSREIHAYNKYAQFIGDSEDDVIMALKQVDALLEPDPRKSRAFEYEVYAKIFDIPENQMDTGVQSILSGNYGEEKVVWKNLYSALANSNITRLGKDEINQETKNVLKNNPALIDQLAEQSINSIKTQDTAIYKIIDAAESGIDPANNELFANEIKEILMSDQKMAEEGMIENVYYELFYNGPTLQGAAYAQVKLSDDPSFVNAWYTASWNLSDHSKMQVAAQVNMQIHGTYADEKEYYDIWYGRISNPEEPQKQKFTEEERLQYFDKYGEFFGSTTDKFVSVNNKISELEVVKATSLKEVNALSKEIEDAQTAEKQLQNQIASLNTQIKENQNTITATKTSINGLKQQLAKSTTELQALNSNKGELSIKLDEQVAKVAKEQELTGKVSAESLALKKEYEAQLSILNQKISNVETESTSINSSMNKITLELNKLKEIQVVTAQKALAAVPEDSDLTLNTTTLNAEAARIGALSLGKSEAEWAAAWVGEAPKTKMVDGVSIELSAEEIQRTQADWAKNSAIQSLSTGTIAKELSIDTNEFKLANVVSSGVMKETLKRQAEYLSQAVSQGIHKMTIEAAREGVKSLGKSEAEWAAAWTGDAPTHKNVNGIRIELTAEEIFKNKASGAMEAAAMGLTIGPSGLQRSGLFTDGNLTLDQESISQASAAAAQAAMDNVQEEAANIATQVASEAESFAILDTSEMSESLKNVITSSEWLSSEAAKGTFTDIAAVEEFIRIDIKALTEDTSSWTEAEWAAAWTGDAPTHNNVNGVRIDLTAEEIQKIMAEGVKNRVQQTKDPYSK